MKLGAAFADEQRDRTVHSRAGGGVIAALQRLAQHCLRRGVAVRNTLAKGVRRGDPVVLLGLGAELRREHRTRSTAVRPGQGGARAPTERVARLRRRRL